MKTILYFLVLLAFQMAFQAKAQEAADGSIFAALSGIYYTDYRTRSSTIDSTNMILDLRAGYGLGSNTFVGLHLEQEELTSKTSGYSTASYNDDVKFSRRSYGPMVGYVLENFYAFFTYVWSSEWKVSSQSATSTYLGGSLGAGYQLDVGFKLPLTASTHLGFHLTYKMLEYKTVQDSNGTTSLSPSMKENKLDPLVSLWYFF